MGRKQGTLEGVVIDRSFWRGRRVLVTGHTGFKGAWLCSWLETLGADILGIALPPESSPNLFEILGLSQRLRSELFDINSADRMGRTLTEFRPEVVIHLAAQSLVRRSYDEPVITFATNVLGTASLLNAIRQTDAVKSVVVVTSDKCYENLESPRGYREDDRLGGHDPYSASKGCAELVARSMQQSFFTPYAERGHHARISTARAGNVIGGGDWSRDRLVPDIIRGCLGDAGGVVLRNPSSVRPWQHVLEPLSGYLVVAQKLTDAPDGIDRPWNFGPNDEENRPVMELARAFVAAFGRGNITVMSEANAPHETQMLRLDSSRARAILGWTPVLAFDETIRLTAEWYLACRRGEDMRSVTTKQIAYYMQRSAALTAARGGNAVADGA